MADVVGTAVGGIELRTAIKEFDQLVAKLMEFGDAVVDLGELVME